ncbi:MAG: SLBB domain-containing protein [Desulfobacteraceae bacterium]|nr:SLBB domain-containing protein [Desulfobacteraceae bacterium]
MYVSGAVAHPGVYEIPADAVTQQAIKAAGGPIEGAVLNMVNLAALLKSGQQIYVPSEKDQSNAASVSIPFPSSRLGFFSVQSVLLWSVIPSAAFRTPRLVDAKEN